jgi:hypothetical protein
MNDKPIQFLQKRHRNDIFQAIQAAGLDPREFDLVDSGTEVQIKHRSSESCFIVRGESGYYVGQSVVGDGHAWPYSPCSWQTLIPQVSRWLEEVQHDLNTPDLWAELRREAELLGSGSNRVIENTPFTPEEQQEIARRLEKLATDVSHALSLSGAQTNAIEGKIDYLIEASTRLGRKDWLNAFIGVTLGFMLVVALPSESARGILLTFFRSIGLLYPELSIE